MPEILTSLHGNRAGIDHDGNFVTPKAFVSGDSPGKGIFLPSPYKAVVFDDFVGDAFNTNLWLSAEGTDSATSDAAILSGGIGGVLRLTSGDAGTGEAADAVTCNGPLQWQASNGKLVMEVRFKVDTITNVMAFIGFTDVATAVEAPVTLSGTTYTTNATDAVGFLFDTGATTDTWRVVGVANDVDASQQDLGVSPVADDYETLRLEVDTLGVTTFYRNGLKIGTQMSGSVTAATDLCALVYWSNLSGTTSRLMDVDYIHVAMNRGLDGTAT